MKDMTEPTIFFADTYAIIEIIGGNQHYKQYLEHILVTSKFNLIELYYHLLHDYNQKIAEAYLRAFAEVVIPISYSSIKLGMAFKLHHKKEKVSYVDCIGWALAYELGIKFLMGDQKFETKENVEYIK